MARRRGGTELAGSFVADERNSQPSARLVKPIATPTALAMELIPHHSHILLGHTALRTNPQSASIAVTRCNSGAPRHMDYGVTLEQRIGG